MLECIGSPKIFGGCFLIAASASQKAINAYISAVNLFKGTFYRMLALRKLSREEIMPQSYSENLAGFFANVTLASA